MDYDFLTVVDTVIAYHRELSKQLGGGLPKEAFDLVNAKAEAAREVLIGFGEIMTERDKERYMRKLQRSLDAVQHDIYFSKLQ